MYRLIAQYKDYAKPLLIAFCVCIGLSNTYIPLPVVIDKDVSIPFPCQSKGCGCSNARQCWSSCCCHSNAEKLAWAKKNNVLPPDWFWEELEQDGPQETGPQKISCCCSCSTQAPAAGAEMSLPESCCSTERFPYSSVVRNPAHAKTKHSLPVRRVRLTLKEQRGCHGFEHGIADLSLKLFVSEIAPLGEFILSEPICCAAPILATALPRSPELFPD